jgi:hypothetical protein
MATLQKTDSLAPIANEVARHVGRYGLTRGKAEGAKAALRVDVALDVKRTVQVYWTPFVAEVPGRSISLHLEVAEPAVHWGEAYLSPGQRNWVFMFGERPDGEIQLLRYGDYATPDEAIDEFFKFVGWYVLEATDKSWPDVTFEIGDDVPWGSTQDAQAEVMASAVQESLKKSTIMWLRFSHDGGEQTLPVWYFFDQKVNKIYVLSGERQQTIPGADQLREVDVILRWKGRNSSVAELPASVKVIGGDDRGWY